MKSHIRKIIREFIQEVELEEDYPASFDMETFKSLGSHAGRNRYAQEHLQRLAAGSSRIVYKIDDQKVLKLAKNDKGIDQNETEIQWGNDSYFSDILAQIFDYDDKNLWVEMELARKVSKPEFKKLTGFDISDVDMFLRNWKEEMRGKRGYFSIDPELKEKLGESEFLQSIQDFSHSADIEIGDFGRLNSYGIVKRNGQDVLVITDYGLTKEVYSTHYDKSKKMRMWEDENIAIDVPTKLYHATYKPLLRKIQDEGLGGPSSKRKWEDSKKGVVYLAIDPYIAESYAESSDLAPESWLEKIVILEINTDDLDQSKFKLDKNVIDNEGDTIEYHGIIPASAIKIHKNNIQEETSNSNYSLKDWPEGKYKGFIKGYDVYSDEIDSGFKATSGLKTTANVPCVIHVKNGHAIVKYDGGLLFSDEEIENKWNNDDL